MEKRPEDRAARVARLLADVEWRTASRRLTLFAYARVGRSSMELAEDLAQEAITRLIDPAYTAWDPDRQPSVMEHLGQIVCGLVQNRRRTASTSREIPFAPEVIATRAGGDAPDRGSARRAMGRRDEEPPRTAAARAPGGDGADTPEDRAVEADEARVRALRLDEALAGDPIARRVVELTRTGVTSVADQAEGLGITMSEVTTARKRVFRALERLEKETKR